MRLTDTHCHLYMDRFEADLPAVIGRAEAAGVVRMLVPGVDRPTSQRAAEVAAGHASVYCAIGVHPTEIRSPDAVDQEGMRELLMLDKVVAVGEIGLDYYWVTDPSQRHDQVTALERQLELAQAANLPVVLHLREADDAESGAASRDMIAILRAWAAGLEARSSPLRGRAGVLHSFSGSADTADHAVDLGFFVGVTGPITYPNADRRRELVRDLPPERLLIETDSPFLAPQEKRGKRNEPAYVVHIADRIASIQSRTPIQVAEATTSNAARLFAWGEPD